MKTQINVRELLADKKQYEWLETLLHDCISWAKDDPNQERLVLDFELDQFLMCLDKPKTVSDWISKFGFGSEKMLSETSLNKLLRGLKKGEIVDDITLDFPVDDSEQTMTLPPAFKNFMITVKGKTDAQINTLLSNLSEQQLRELLKNSDEELSNDYLPLYVLRDKAVKFIQNRNRETTDDSEKPVFGTMLVDWENSLKDYSRSELYDLANKMDIFINTTLTDGGLRNQIYSELKNSVTPKKRKPTLEHIKTSIAMRETSKQTTHDEFLNQQTFAFMQGYEDFQAGAIRANDGKEDVQYIKGVKYAEQCKEAAEQHP